MGLGGEGSWGESPPNAPLFTPLAAVTSVFPQETGGVLVRLCPFGCLAI